MDPRYWRARVRCVNEILALFDAEDDEQLLGNFLRAEAEALWSPGEQAAAEERYEALIARLPNFAWGYIGLADCSWLGPDPTPEPKEYLRAEAVYLRALANWRPLSASTARRGSYGACFPALLRRDRASSGSRFRAQVSTCRC
jgi:hypothetical protein